MQIAIADTTGNVSIWCNVNSINEDGSINFWVINGAWPGRYHNNRIFIEKDTEASFPGMLVWVGKAKFSNWDYNEAIHWIQDQIDDPDYVMTQPDQYVEPVREYKDEDEWDDVPF
jgi:hypothetical protein